MKFYSLLFGLLVSLTISAQNCDSTFKDTDGVTVYICADKKPVFPGGSAGYNDFIEKNMKYPSKAFEANTQGEIVVQIIVDEKGKVKPFKIVETIKGPGADECEKEAMRLMGILPKVEPALIKGKPVRMTLRTVVEFRTEPEVVETIVELGSETIEGDIEVAPPPPPPPGGERSERPYPVAVEDEATEQEVYTIVEDMPQFPGGETALLKYITDNLQYPETAKKAGTQGIVFVTFVVETDGSLTGVRVIRSISGPESKLFDAEAVRVVKGMPKWQSGKQNGKPVRVQFNLPVKFRIE